MAHTFDYRGLEHILVDARQLLSGLLDHERQLGVLLESVRSGGPLVRQSAALGELSISARTNRQSAAAMLTRLVGEALHAESSPPRPVVLVVDDSRDYRELIAAALEASGFFAITAGNGLEGVIAAHYARPSAILMDITMPVLDGIEAARLLKSSLVTRHVNLIAHTALWERHATPLASLFAEVLPKPSRADAIIASVRRFAMA
jgi:CheY-like chemotaxis protein